MYEKAGRPRSADSILMGIKGLVLEHYNRPEFRDPHVRDFMDKLRATYCHGSIFVAKVYMDKVKEIELLIRSQK